MFGKQHTGKRILDREIGKLQKENATMKEFIQNLYDDTSTNGHVPLYVIKRLKNEVGRMGGIL